MTKDISDDTFTSTNYIIFESKKNLLYFIIAKSFVGLISKTNNILSTIILLLSLNPLKCFIKI